MSQSIVVKSFAELAELIDLDDLPDDSLAYGAASAAVSTVRGNGVADLQELLAELETAGTTLAAIGQEDQEARDLALRDLERYETLVAQQREAELASERAQQMRREADAFATGAFTEAARAAARRVVEVATHIVTAAALLADERRQAAERLAMGLDLERAVAERRHQEAAEQAKVAEAERARRLSGALVAVREALQAGRFEEANEVLGSAASEYPDNSEIASLKDIIAQRELAVKMSTAEEVLWTVRRELRRDSAAAVERLEVLDVDGLPEPLAKQLFGEWARACARLCRERSIAAPLRYAPDPGRGAIIARESSTASYAVVSALGMGPAWKPGSVVSERQVRRARPLR